MEESRESSIVLIRLPARRTSNRSVSPINASLSANEKPCGGVRLFRVLARTLGRRSLKQQSQQKQEQHQHQQQDDLEDDSRSSSTDSFYSSGNKLAKGGSCSSGDSSGGDSGYPQGQNERYGLGSGGFGSGSGSDTGSESAGQGTNERQSRASSFRRAFQNLSISRSQSTDAISTSIKPMRRQKKTDTPKRILRSPVTYTYVRGMSGLPTQRVPRNTQTQRTCCNSTQKTR